MPEAVIVGYIGEPGANPGGRGVDGLQTAAAESVELHARHLGAEAGVIGGHQDAVDHAHPRRRIGQRGHNHQLVGVGHDGSLERIVVVRSTT